MLPENRIKCLARSRQWDVVRAAQIATRTVAVLERNRGPLVCKIAPEGNDVVVYHGPVASRMLHPRTKTKFKHFTDFA